MGTEVAPRPQPARVTDYHRELAGAAMLLKSGLIPSDIRTPEAALFCILAGKDLGLSPVQSLRCIRPIKGKLEVSADAQLGLYVQQGGRFEWQSITDSEAVLVLHAPWMTKPHTSSFTAKDAQRAGLQGDNWKKYPKAMLRSRAITQGLKDVGFLQGAGVYAPGELGGGAAVSEDGEVVPEAVEVGTLEPPKRRGWEDLTDSELQDVYLLAIADGKTGKRDKAKAEAERRGLTLLEPSDDPSLHKVPVPLQVVAPGDAEVDTLFDKAKA